MPIALRRSNIRRMLAWILTLARLPLAAIFALLAAWGFKLYGPIDNWPGILFWSLTAVAIAEELSDMFDGLAARRCGTVSELGGLADPLCDSLGRLTIYFTLALTGLINIAVPLLMCARDIVCAYVRVVLASTGMKTSARLSGKLKAIVQAAGIFIILALSRWGQKLFSTDLSNTLLAATAWLVAITTAISGLDYCRAATAAVKQMLKTPSHK